MPLAWPVVQCVFDRTDHIIRYRSKVRAFGKVPTDQSVGILIGTSLPGVIRMSQVVVQCEGARNMVTSCVFRAIVDGQCLAQARGECPEASTDGIACLLRRAVCELGDTYESGPALNERVEAESTCP